MAQCHFKAVIFDLGGVLIPSPMEYWAKELEPSLGLAPNSILACLQSESVQPLFQRLERGELSLEDFEFLFAHFYGKKHGFSQPVPLFSKYTSWSGSIDTRWVEFLKALRAEGLHTALLTNNFYRDRAKLEETLPGVDRSLFDEILESCRIGLRKPDKAIFEHALNKLKVTPQEAIFVDDLGTNLKSARELGIHTIKCIDVTKCIAELKKLLCLNFNGVALGTRVPTKNEQQLSLTALSAYFHAKLSIESTNNDLTVRKFANGQSNPTYLISIGAEHKFVLRKKPPGKLLASAHRIEREFRVQKALAGLVPVPKMVDYAEGVLTEPFYLMEYCPGQILHDSNCTGLEAAQGKHIWLEMCRILARIHSVEPGKVELADFGKSGDYFRRNMTRMRAELKQSSKKVELARRILSWLEAKCPDCLGQPVIVHGDFRLDNLIWSSDLRRVQAVLDWELSTLGDPLTDLANLLLPFYIPASLNNLIGPFKSVRPSPENGIPSLEQLIRAYLEERARLGRPEPRAKALLSAESVLLRFGLVYALFRNAVILRGVYQRFQRGQASNAATAQQMADVPERLLATAWAIIGRGTEQWKQCETAGFPLTPEMMRPAAFAIYEDVKEFINEEIIPKERQIADWTANEQTRWTVCPTMEELKVYQKWEHLDPKGQFGGRGLSTAEYGHICELLGKSPIAAEVFNCSAPDTGNMEVLIKYGSEQQQRQFLQPLLEGRIRSCFAMTEPDVASSDATNIQGCIIRDGQHFLLNARKWFTSGAADPRCRLCLFMGRILKLRGDDLVPLHQRQSIIVVPMPNPGLTVVRCLSVLGNYDPPGGHCELLFHNVCVPVENLVLGEGRGFEIAQGRLGPGRIHHCMRLIGHGERALELLKERIQWRRIGTKGTPLVDKQAVRLDLAKCRIELEQARLLVLKAAHLIDLKGTKAAAAEIAAIKVVAPNAVSRVLDRVIQTFGAAGLSADFPLAFFAVWARSLRLADGPDIVHLETVAKRELAKL